MTATPAKARIAVAVAGLSVGLLAFGVLRTVTLRHDGLPWLAPFVTPGYVMLVVVLTVVLLRAGLPLDRLGFGARPGLRHALLALAAIALLRLTVVTLAPLWESLLGGGRHLDRFADVQGSLPALLSLLALSWTVAAFGEELTYRIVLMRGIAFVLGDSRRAWGAALVLQAGLFGLAHAYQGPAGIVGTVTSGLVYGAVTWLARGSIWPAALAHGVNNTIGIVTLYLG